MLLYLTSFILGSSTAYLVWKKGHALGLMDKPCERSSHESPTPKGGGIGIFLAFVLASIEAGFSFWFWLPLVVMSIIALVGDRVELSARFRLTAQLALTALIVTLAGSGALPEGLLYPVLVFFWILFIAGTANYYNFMDGINGIAGITGIIAFGFIGLYAGIIDGPPKVQTMALCISFACMGFLPFNLPQAKAFMGDVGSILLGALFAGLIFLSAGSVLDFVCMAAFLFTFYADELTTAYVRLRDGEKLTQPHRRHFYQILANETGIGHWKVSAGFGLVQVFVGMGVLLLRDQGVLMVLGFLGVCFLVFIVVSFRVRAVVDGRSAYKNKTYIP
jgi:UDP-N-acetylmuramyl pentapeptide phosphotransferase/UDP-N-acetylglucosamine-1-phosphate transferase